MFRSKGKARTHLFASRYFAKLLLWDFFSLKKLQPKMFSKNCLPEFPSYHSHHSHHSQRLCSLEKKQRRKKNDLCYLLFARFTLRQSCFGFRLCNEFRIRIAEVSSENTSAARLWGVVVQGHEQKWLMTNDSDKQSFLPKTINKPFAASCI